MKKRHLTISLLLHLALLLTVAKTKDGMLKESGNNRPGRKEEVVLKTIEANIIEFIPKTTDSEITIPAPRKPIKGLKECEGDRWYGGIGIQQDFVTDIIDTVYAGYPADLAGIKPGDKIQSTSSAEGADIRGPPGTTVNILIFRKSTNETLNLSITRGKICLEEKD